jgi:hypothetical protein
LLRYNHARLAFGHVTCEQRGNPIILDASRVGVSPSGIELDDTATIGLGFTPAESAISHAITIPCRDSARREVHIPLQIRLAIIPRVVERKRIGRLSKISLVKARGFVLTAFVNVATRTGREAAGVVRGPNLNRPVRRVLVASFR